MIDFIVLNNRDVYLVAILYGLPLFTQETQQKTDVRPFVAYINRSCGKVD
jgi:hypothetical protein